MKKLLSGLFSVLFTVGVAVASPVSDGIAHKLHKAGDGAIPVSQAPPTKKHGIALPQSLGDNHRKEGGFLTTVSGPCMTDRKTSPLKNAPGVQAPRLQGNVTFSNSWGEGMSQGIYSIPAADGENFNLIYPGEFGKYGNFEIDGVYYTSIYEDWWGLYIIKHTAWDATTGLKKYDFDGDSPAEIVIDAALDPTTETMYGITFNDDCTGYRLAKIEFRLGRISATRIGDFDCNVCALAIDGSGQMYAIAKTTEKQGSKDVCTESRLLKVDKTNASYETIGVTGCLPQFLSSATIDRKTGRMFWTVNTIEATGALYEVNLADGSASLVCSFPGGEEVVGLVTSAPEADEGAPSEAKDLQAIFEDGSLSGKIKFTAPATIYSGAAGTGTLSYEIRANGILAASGNTSFGAETEADVDVPVAGTYEFSVITANEAGQSPVAKISAFIGNGIPKAPANVKCVYSAGKINISWEAVTESADGGFINPSEVNYTVKRADGTIAASALSALSFSEEMEEPSQIISYYYEVRANHRGLESEAGVSNTISLGNISLPYSIDFTDPSATPVGYVVIDANNDGKTWTWSSQGARAEYDNYNTMDDWLMTPGMKLDAGYCYSVEFEAKIGLSGENERIELMAGRSASPENMTISIAPATEITSTTFVKYSGEITCTESGTYYLGFHGISDPFKYYLYVKGLKISSGTEAVTPGPVTGLTVVPDPDGALSAEISFKTPSIDKKGQPLESISRIEILRNDVVIREFTNPETGKDLSYTDRPYESGNMKYSVVAYNAAGAGSIESVTVFVGIDIPAAPTGVKVVETDNPGEITVTWNAVTTDRNGNPVKPSAVTYGVCVPDDASATWLIKEKDISGTSYTFDYLDDKSSQDFATIGVVAFTASGAGEVSAAEMIPVGKPYDGLEESAANGRLSYLWTAQSDNATSSVEIYNDSKLDGIHSYDNDNGYIAIYSQNSYDGAEILSGKISLAGIENPMLTFYTYGLFDPTYGNCMNTISVYVRECGELQWSKLYEKTVSEIAPNDEWGRVSVNLKEYAGKTVQLRISSLIVTYTLTLIDKISIATPVMHDLSILSIDAPALVKPGNDYDINVTVVNNGYETAGTYTVELYADEAKVATETRNALESDKRELVTFRRTLHTLDAGTYSYYAVVVYDADENMSDNTSETVVVSSDISHLPRITDLSASATTNGVALTWSEPDISLLPEIVEEDFEDGESFAKSFAGWVFVDLDKAPTGGIDNVEIPGITHGITLASFFVFDTSLPQFNSTFDAHSGTKYLASIYRRDNGKSDEWAISPELSGNIQTISFYARSYDESYPEIIEVYYSTGSTDPKDFVKVRNAATVPQTWTLYTAQLPAGAKRFAVRSCATGAFVLMLDDFTYEISTDSGSISLAGYNVYRDGEKINASPVGENEYLDSEAPAGLHRYVVTALYDRGESAASNEVSVEASSIASPSSTVNVTTANGSIIVGAADGMNVVVIAADGRILYTGTGSARIAVSPGVYIVKVNDTVHKVMVR